LPSISIVITTILFYLKYAYPSQRLCKAARNRLGIFVVLVLMLAYLFIAASFAPSAYGQSYPVPRARFAGRVLMTVALMTEGAFLGTLITQVGNKFFQSTYLRDFE